MSRIHMNQILIFIDKPRSVCLKYCDNCESFVEHLSKMDDIYKNIDECIQIKNVKYWLCLKI